VRLGDAESGSVEFTVGLAADPFAAREPRILGEDTGSCVHPHNARRPAKASARAAIVADVLDRPIFEAP